MRINRLIHKSFPFALLPFIGLLAWMGVIAKTGLKTPEGGNQGWPDISLTKVVGGLGLPVHITHAGDASDRLFIVEQSGRIRILKNGFLITQPFLDISGQVRSPANGGGSEEGLLSVAFPPGFAFKSHFYVYYTNLEGDNVVARFFVSAEADLADPGREEVLLLLAHPNHRNHNGGQLAFGPDGYLYIGPGDGGGAGDPNQNAQNLDSLLGKILRIAVEASDIPSATLSDQVFLPFITQNSVPGNPAPPYSIPPDNPFTDVSGARGEIWAYGLRNPWRFSFDRLSGDLYIGDVGQGGFEEVNFQMAPSPGGVNYGWNIMEGYQCFQSASCDKTGLELPVFVYPTHSQGGCAITGGFVYRGQANPGMQGIYFFGDYCNGIIRGLQQDAGEWLQQELSDTPFQISSFGEDESGELYLADYGKGDIYRVDEGP